ncbi:MAG: hypothetical protein RBU21_04600 [FCB group bacterium]|nr:hypothetical protein [FCB group bacterium]
MEPVQHAWQLVTTKQGQKGKKEMADSLDDLDFPHIAERLFRSSAVGRRRPKPRALGVVKSWRYIFHMEDGRQLCVGKEYVGTEPEAMWEGENRLVKHETGGGETPVSIEVQSQGKPNNPICVKSGAERDGDG